MKITGTASQCNKIADISPIASNIICGRLFFMEKFLNLKAITGRLLTISQLVISIIAYNTQLLMSQFINV